MKVNKEVKKTFSVCHLSLSYWQSTKILCFPFLLVLVKIGQRVLLTRMFEGEKTLSVRRRESKERTVANQTNSLTSSTAIFVIHYD
jgi:hypothetical protein